MSEPVPHEMQAYYELGLEANRLFHGHGHLELARTQEIILRHLPPAPCAGLDVSGASVPVVLLLGPLYHLTEREDRLQALRQAHRVLEPGGLLFAAAVD